MLSNIYEQEQDNYLKYILENEIYPILKIKDGKSVRKKPITAIELFLTPECNLNCQYCYLHNNQERIYPKKFQDHTIILRNIDYLMNYFAEEKFFVRKLALFTGEIWGSQFGIDVLEKIYQHLHQYHLCEIVMIASNMSFVLNDLYTYQIEQYIKKFKDIGIILQFSASIDGKIIEDKTRPFKDSSLLHTDIFYDKVFTFCAKYKYGFHPMLWSKSIKYWKENYEWYEQMCNKYHLDILKEVMLFEVRNDDWTQQDILDYLNFLTFLFNKYLIYFNNDITEIIKYIYQLTDEYTIVPYNPLRLIQMNNKLHCSIQNTFSIRVGDMSIIPCHRTSYEELNFGQYIVNNGKITDIKSNNPEMALYIYSVNPKIGFPKCDICKFKHLCMKGCYGAQLEANYDLTHPCHTVCDLLSAKIQYLIELYDKTGMFDCLNEIAQQTTNFGQIQSLLNIVNNLKEELKGDEKLLE